MRREKLRFPGFPTRIFPRRLREGNAACASPSCSFRIGVSPPRAFLPPGATFGCRLQPPGGAAPRWSQVFGGASVWFLPAAAWEKAKQTRRVSWGEAAVAAEGRPCPARLGRRLSLFALPSALSDEHPQEEAAGDRGCFALQGLPTPAMATIVSEKLSRLFISAQHFWKVPRLLEEALPSASCTVEASDVPRLFQKPYIHAGYRPLNQTWKYYFLSLFQRHNEAVNVWTHLVAALVLVVRFWRLSQVVDFLGDPHTQPLFVIAASSVIYATFSTLAHLLQAKSEFWHCAFFFLDYVGVATYQYSSALVHYYYAIEPEWHTRVAGFYIPGAILLAWLSCAGSCYAKYRSPHLSSLRGRLCQEMPSALAYALDISPVLHRIYVSPSSGLTDVAVLYHKCHVLFFLIAAFFFAYPYPEKWFPGKCHFVGQGHQIFHVFLMLCTLTQVEAVLLDYETRRPIYSRLHGDLAPLFSSLCLLVASICFFTALLMTARVQRKLHRKEE
ncbi:membrane progestin receptor alpha isoform X1 [Podarcis raffonei]|uniref:membrane progestin receptor alpha isoform X1 n=1 Tax=Podarcis raffonei TaxID=65483 RepID=UPI0023299245|nr:membrane progestin receptor alpha isoform X1 [Podarcis raffonei]